MVRCVILLVRQDSIAIRTSVYHAERTVSRAQTRNTVLHVTIVPSDIKAGVSLSALSSCSNETRLVCRVTERERARSVTTQDIATDVRKGISCRREFVRTLVGVVIMSLMMGHVTRAALIVTRV